MKKSTRGNPVGGCGGGAAPAPPDVKGPTRTGILLLPRHTWQNYQKYAARGEPMPVAIFIGHHALYYMAAAVSGPYGLDEFEVAGSFPGEPVPLVRYETVDLEVPAEAEIVS